MLKQLKNHRKVIMLMLFVSILATSGFDYAHADTNTGKTLASGGIYLAVFIGAGVLWSFSGLISNLRSHMNFLKETAQTQQKDSNGKWLDGWNGFDRTAMKDDVFIALILGTVAFVINGANTIPDITTVQSFLAAIVASYGLIGLTDKLGVSGILNR